MKGKEPKKQDNERATRANRQSKKHADEHDDWMNDYGMPSEYVD